LEGDELQDGYCMETEFPAGLAWVTAKSLSGSGGVSRVRSGLGRVTGLRHFPYLGAIGLAELARVKLRYGKNFTSGWF
jgi:hypothetical protein